MPPASAGCGRRLELERSLHGPGHAELHFHSFWDTGVTALRAGALKLHRDPELFGAECVPARARRGLVRGCS